MHVHSFHMERNQAHEVFMRHKRIPHAKVQKNVWWQRVLSVAFLIGKLSHNVFFKYACTIFGIGDSYLFVASVFLC